jgi:hypothetical protein
MAESIRTSPPPKRLSEDQKEIYRGILEDEAGKIEVFAIDAFKRALGVTKDQSWFNQYSKKAEIALARLRPKEFRRPSELRAEPEYYKLGFGRAMFIKTSEEEDRLTDMATDE